LESEKSRTHPVTRQAQQPARLIHSGLDVGFAGTLAACVAEWHRLSPARRSESVITVLDAIKDRFVLEADDIRKWQRAFLRRAA
jgi:hypothetical protein